MSKQAGNNPRHLIRQLKKLGRLDLVRSVQQGTRSAFEAAVEAGIRQRHRREPVTARARLLARRKRELGLDERLTGDQFNELWLGPGRDSAFAGDRERHQAWITNRTVFMLTGTGDGRRCWGWWAYECPIPYPGHEHQRSALFEAGLLTEAEREHVLREWRHEFERSFAPHFFYCAGPGEFLDGLRGRFAHYRWADIPPRLVRAWNLERRAAERRIRVMEAEAQQPAQET